MKMVKPNSLVVGLGCITLALTALYALPFLTTKRTFSFATQSAVEPGHKLLEEAIRKKPLKMIYSPQGTTSTTTLDAILAKNPQGVIVNFWATWCPPCIEEFPSLAYLGKELPNTPNAPLLITLSVDERAADVLQFFKTLSYSPSLAVLHDPDGEVARSLGTSKFPETYLFNSKGEVLYKWIGPQEWLGKDVLETIHHYTQK